MRNGPWPSVRPTSNWKNKSPDAYIENVRGYAEICRQKGEEYWRDRKFIQLDKTFPSSPPEFNGWSLVFHSKEPRIGFQKDGASPSRDFLGSLCNVMCDFVKSKNILGCHLCLCLGASFATFDPEFQQKSVYGYLQLTSDKYFELNPQRLKWYEDTKANKVVIVLT